MSFEIQPFLEARKAGNTHTPASMLAFVEGIMDGTVADYQTSAWLMAACLKPLSLEETIALTEAYVKSGQVLDLSQITKPTVDKHSTGGVGDKATLVVTPILAACGVAVAKLSGRGLGLTGGTVDKLESIPNFNCQISTTQFLQQLNTIGLAIASQTADLAPADGKTYALRDVTATVANLPLIAASVMSKKIAAGAQTISLDVKYGSGAFMPNQTDAQELANWCVAIGNHFGRKTIAHLSDMNQPLGYAVGNAIEVEEAIDCLKGNWPPDLKALTLDLCSDTLVAAMPELNFEAAQTQVEQAISNGLALQKLGELLEAQGANPKVIDTPKQFLPQAQSQLVLKAETSGIIQQIDAHHIAKAAFALGSGRLLKTDTIDFAVGIKVLKKVGQPIEKGTPWAEILYNNKGLEEAQAFCQQAFVIK